MATNQFVARNGIISLDDITVTGSITATGGINISGSIASASYAATSSFASNFNVANTLTATTLVVNTVSSSVVYSSGSNVFGNALSNTQVFTGSVGITGSLSVNGALSGAGATFTGALTGTSATFSDVVTGTGNAATNSAIIFNNPSGASGTAQYYGDFKAGATVIGRILRGNGAASLEANGLNIDNFAGFKVRLNQLGGSGGTFSVDGGAATFASTVTTGGQLALTSGFGTSTAAISIYNNTASNASNVAQIDFRVNNTFGGNERIASITALNPNASGNNGGALVFSVSANGTGTIPSEDMRITQSGNVGIGTTDPDFGSFGAGEKILGISNSSARARLQLQNTSTGTTGVAGSFAFFNGSTQLASIDIIADGATNKGRYVFNTNDGTSNAERMRITSGGDVAIGTTTDYSVKLAVLLTSNNSISTVPAVMRIMNNGINFIPKILITDNNTADATICLAGGSGAKRLSFGVQGITSGFEYFNILENGNIGIGTTAPGGTYGKLSVAGGIRIFDDNNAKLEIGRYSSGVANSYIKLGANSNSLRITNNTDAADVFIINNNGSLIQNGVNVQLTKTGGTSVTFTLTLGSIGAWTPGYATIRVSGTRGGLQEHYAAMYFLKLVYFQSSNVTSVNNVSGDTGSASIAVTTAFTSGNTVMTITISDVGASTDYMIADIDGSFQTGVGSIT